MPRYFFNVHDGVDIEDKVGTELDGDDEARIEALRTSGELLRDFSKKGLWLGHQWSLEVTDQHNRRVATLRFSGETHGPEERH